MKLRQLIHKVQQYSGLPLSESKEALLVMVESLSVRLGEAERVAFARRLPQELEDIALSVYPSIENSSSDLVTQFMQNEGIGESLAKRQIRAAWQALRDAISEAEMDNIKRELPSSVGALP